jgi:hypothetical protein
MPKLFNTVTKKTMWMPAHYVGQYPFELVEEIVEAPKPAKKKAQYVADAIDSDGDGRVQDGTPFEREAGTELSPEEVTAIEAVADQE